MNISIKVKNYLKLFAAGIVFVWLFIQSPLNPLYSGYDQAELYFVKFNFIYWVLVSAMVLWIVFYINRSNFEKHSGIIFLLSNFLFLSFFVFYGYDVLDSGFSLSKQWSMFHGMWSENFDAIAGTNLIGGLWLVIIGKPNLLWSRLGFVLVQVSSVFLSFKILLLYFKPKQTFVVALPLSLFFATWSAYQTINYDNLPFLFFLATIYLLLTGLKKAKFQKKYFIASGIIIVFATFCKITYAVSLLLPLFLIVLDHSLMKKSINLLKNKILYFLFGMIISFGFLAVLVFAIGGFESYISYFMEIIKELVSVKDPTRIYSQNHSFLSLYSAYKDNILGIISNIFKYALVILLIEYLIGKSRNLRPIKYFLIILGTFVLYYMTFELNTSNQYTNNNFLLIPSLFLSIYILWIVFTENSTIKRYAVIIMTAGGLFLISFIGSDLVFRCAFQAGSGLILFSIPIILIKNTRIILNNVIIKFTFLFYFVVVIFSFNAINKKDNIYREPNFKFISKPFQSNVLSGIKSNPQRVEVVDSLLTFLNKIPNLKEKKIMFTHSNVIMYYLTETNYILGSPWDILSDFYTLEQTLNIQMPDIFVIPKESHRLRMWPLKSKSDTVEKRAQKHYDVYDKFIKENNYIEIYKNSFYTVYSSENQGIN